jgi:hypothetical protein
MQVSLDIEPPEALWPETKGPGSEPGQGTGHPLHGCGRSREEGSPGRARSVTAPGKGRWWLRGPGRDGDRLVKAEGINDVVVFLTDMISGKRQTRCSGLI